MPPSLFPSTFEEDQKNGFVCIYEIGYLIDPKHLPGLPMGTATSKGAWFNVAQVTAL